MRKARRQEQARRRAGVRFETGPGVEADRLLEEEIAAREERRIRNSLKLSGLPFLKTLDGFDFAFQPPLDRGRVMDLASLAFLARKENVLLLGPPGVGKTPGPSRWRSAPARTGFRCTSPPSTP